MFVNGLGTANPPLRYSKAECWEAFKTSDWFRKLDRRSHIIAETVLTKDNGIEFRSLAVPSLSAVFDIDPDTLHARFLANAPALGAEAGTAALADAHLDADAIDAVVISTCTGYLCPGLTSYVVERLGLRADVLAFDLVLFAFEIALVFKIRFSQLPDLWVISGGYFCGKLVGGVFGALEPVSQRNPLVMDAVNIAVQLF